MSRVSRRLNVAAQRDLPFAIVRPSLLLEDLIDIYLAIEKVCSAVLCVAHALNQNESPLLGHAESLVNPISVLDVASVIVHIIEHRAFYARKQVEWADAGVV